MISDSEIIGQMIEPLWLKEFQLKVALDRNGEGGQIENWIPVEMNATLINCAKAVIFLWSKGDVNTQAERKVFATSGGKMEMRCG